MDECGDYSIRGDVANIRERDPMMNYPFILPQGLTEEQIRSLLPLLTSRKCKRWDCLLCVKQFMEQHCPHDHHQQLAAIEEAAAGPSVDAAPLFTKTNRSIVVEKIDAVQVLICTEGSENAEVLECITNKQQSDDNSEPKVFFDLNVPIVEPYDEALENSNNHAPATEGLAVANYNPECSTTEPVSVDKQQSIDLEAPEPEASAQEPNNGGSGNSENVSSPSPPEILVPNGKKTLRIKKPRKYHSISFLNQEAKREASQNAPNSNPQSNKTELKKMQQCRTDQEGPAGTKISEATENGSEQDRTIDCNLPLKQNFVLANVSPSPRRESSGKRKHQVNHDQNGSSDAIISKSSEEGHQNESRSVDIQLRKRRVFCSVTKTLLADADKSQRVEPVIGHKSKKNRPSRKESLIIPVADLGNSHSTRIKKGTRKAAYQLMLRRKPKNIKSGEPSGTDLDKASPEKSSPVVAVKELVLQDKPISTIQKDVQMPCLQDDNFNLKQLKSEIIKTLKRHKFDSPSADNNNNQKVVIRTGENGNSEKSGGNRKGDANMMLGAPPQEKKKEIDKKSSPNVLKTRGRLKKVQTGCARSSSSGTKKKQDDKQAASFGKDITTTMKTTTKLPSEAALQLLSMVAVDTLENGASFLPIMEEFHVPPITSVLEMGYEGCIEVTNPADYFLVDGDGDRFKLEPEDLPLRPHRLLPPKCLHIAIPTIAAGTRLAAPEE